MLLMNSYALETQSTRVLSGLRNRTGNLSLQVILHKSSDTPNKPGAHCGHVVTKTAG